MPGGRLSTLARAMRERALFEAPAVPGGGTPSPSGGISSPGGAPERAGRGVVSRRGLLRMGGAFGVSAAVAACTARGIWFTIVPDLLTNPTAELAIALALGISRKVLEGDRIVRSGAYGGWRPILYGTGLHGRTAGIVGMGKLGRALASRLSTFGMKILYSDPVALPGAMETDLGATRMELAELLASSDFVFLLLPLTPETFHLFGSATLGRMKRGSFLINIGRGSTVDEKAIARALASGRLAGYAADVFEMEDWALPNRPKSVHRALRAQTAKTLFTSHLGSAVREARLEIEMRAAHNIVEALSDRRPPDAINEITVRPGSSS